MARNVEKVTVSLTDTANVRNGAIERADNLSAQLAASFCREDTYKLELTAVKSDSVKIPAERANLLLSANNLVAEVREAFADPDGAPQAAVQSSDRFSEDVADKVEAEMEQI